MFEGSLGKKLTGITRQRSAFNLPAGQDIFHKNLINVALSEYRLWRRIILRQCFKVFSDPTQFVANP